MDWSTLAPTQITIEDELDHANCGREHQLLADPNWKQETQKSIMWQKVQKTSAARNNLIYSKNWHVAMQPNVHMKSKTQRIKAEERNTKSLKAEEQKEETRNATARNGNARTAINRS